MHECLMAQVFDKQMNPTTIMFNMIGYRWKIISGGPYEYHQSES